MDGVSNPLGSLNDLCSAIYTDLNEKANESDFRFLQLPQVDYEPVQNIINIFALTEYEASVLLLAATCEVLPGQMIQLCAEVIGLEPVHHAFLTPIAIRRWLQDCPHGSHHEAFSVAGKLRHFGLITVTPSPLNGGSEAFSNVQLAPGMLAWLRGLVKPTGECANLLKRVNAPGWRGKAQQKALDEIRAVWDYAHRNEANRVVWPVINLYGDTLTVLKDTVSHIDAENSWLISGEVLACLDQVTLRLLKRDLFLLRDLLIIEEDGLELDFGDTEKSGKRGLETIKTFIDEIDIPVVILSREPTHMRLHRDMYSVATAGMTPQEMIDIWIAEFNLPDLSSTRKKLEALVAQFYFSNERIARIKSNVYRRLNVLKVERTTVEQVLELLWEQSQVEGRKAFQGVADRVVSKAKRNDLVLPPQDWLTLDEIANHVRLRHQVYQQWGSQNNARGNGITVLFSGVSGGGKTFAAEVLANELKLDLYRIDLSKVASKWIGETEKNLKRIFDAADEGGAILLFDEADSVFGKRGAAQSSNDRYANMTTNYLLQRMESYKGLAILTTNFEGNIDSAFTRRIRFTIGFRKPDPEMRMRLWQKAFPESMEVHDIDFQQFVHWELSGANIKSIALNASFMAASRGEAVDTGIIREAAHRELYRMGHVRLE